MIKCILKTSELIKERETELLNIGFVPTMGNLHQGHISLLIEALKEFKTVYFSIFVNPKQFGPSEDFNRYPRTLERDIELIQNSLLQFPDSKVIIFAPENPEEVFPKDGQQVISVNGLSTVLEGKIRPGHFDGVATVVYRLFDIIKPSKAYFGLKDYQQYLVIKQMVNDLALPINIQGMPIIREAQGLALSSRNQYLTPEQKSISLILFNTLSTIKEMIGHKRINITKAKNFISETLKDSNWNYLEMRDSETFSEDINHSKNITILAVYQIGTTRLLDNMQVEVQ
jgi:pantoate--beta-alanine ligase